ncbi:hypothetical protein [uncultured Methylophaga sp.]|uniref:hypothetical protein n=1 Tax=uncultured Methylophaga sp. TaxID=285271 RepID=UPI00262115A7|nr:hypothetical protein [uncultured Methylophaga sp.]|tara:strand:- start:8 stop:562 length:555 start_codon:yes stop_codon:yes gene_type:complete
MSGKLLQKTISSSSELLHSERVRHLLIFLAGALAMVLHETFRFGLDMPGRQGLTLMAILIFVRCSAPYAYTATLAGAGGLVAALIVRDNPSAALILLSQGALLDVIYRRLSRQSVTLWLLPLAAGMVHMVKPAFKFGLIMVAGVETDSFRHGITYPFITHFIFGSVGGLIGFMAWRSLRKKSNN